LIVQQWPEQNDFVAFFFPFFFHSVPPLPFFPLPVKRNVYTPLSHHSVDRQLAPADAATPGALTPFLPFYFFPLSLSPSFLPSVAPPIPSIRDMSHRIFFPLLLVTSRAGHVHFD